jgi:hypothetical protein
MMISHVIDNVTDHVVDKIGFVKRIFAAPPKMGKIWAEGRNQRRKPLRPTRVNRRNPK